MITGIGTPSSQSKIPLPIVTLLHSSRLPGQREGEGKVPREKRLMAFTSGFYVGISESDSPIMNSE
ncbi:MAG TPA: hypothetical protein VHJ00_17595 [Bradyrhizobium sp.]|jgi:hypothetical protein|nr:hypothetical protein [Bradyrhizobium sp.]